MFSWRRPQQISSGNVVTIDSIALMFVSKAAAVSRIASVDISPTITFVCDAPTKDA
jgi:hypothetical protein